MNSLEQAEATSAVGFGLSVCVLVCLSAAGFSSSLPSIIFVSRIMQMDDSVTLKCLAKTLRATCFLSSYLMPVIDSLRANGAPLWYERLDATTHIQNGFWSVLLFV